MRKLKERVQKPKHNLGGVSLVSGAGGLGASFN